VDQFKKIIKLVSLFLLLLSIPTTTYGQDERETKARKDLDNKKTTDQDGLRKELIKKHRAGQTKETRKRIKRSKREAKRRKQGKNPVPWWDRMFRSKKRKTKRKKRS
jgi:hypothetical protein